MASAVAAMSCGLTRSAACSCSAAPANSERTRTPGILGGLGGDELLGDEVHAVVERRDEADAGEAVEAGEVPRE